MATKKSSKAKTDAGKGGVARLIDGKIRSLGDWRGEMLARIRTLIHEAAPGVAEQVKWRKPSNPNGVPVWEHDGILCTGETYQDKVKLTFAKGASLPDPKGLFNAGLDGNARRAIDLFEGDKLDAGARPLRSRPTNPRKAGVGPPYIRCRHATCPSAYPFMGEVI